MKLKLFLAISVLINLAMGIFAAEHLGKIKGLEEVNQIYLSVACQSLPEFRSVLENYNTDHLPVDVTPEIKQRWVDKHLSGCAFTSCVEMDGKNGEKPYLVCR